MVAEGRSCYLWVPEPTMTIAQTLHPSHHGIYSCKNQLEWVDIAFHNPSIPLSLIPTHEVGWGRHGCSPSRSGKLRPSKFKRVVNGRLQREPQLDLKPPHFWRIILLGPEEAPGGPGMGGHGSFCGGFGSGIWGQGWGQGRERGPRRGKAERTSGSPLPSWAAWSKKWRSSPWRRSISSLCYQGIWDRSLFPGSIP